MSEFMKNKKRNLLAWIKDCENNFDERNTEFDKDKKYYFKKIYEDTNHIRKYFFDNYLKKISNNLNAKSNKESYQYKDFFKHEDKSELINKYFSLFEKTNKKNYKYEYKGKENIKENNYNYNKKENKQDYFTSKYKKR